MPETGAGMERHLSDDVERVSERMERSLCVDTEDPLETYSRLVQEAKAAGRGGDMHKALTLFEKAYDIHPSDKLKSRIQKVKEFLSEVQSEEEDDEDFVDVNGCGLLLFKDLHNKLYDYQKEGVAFLYRLYNNRLKGGILADDMGLGKTIQVISFLSGMYDLDHVKFTILVVPTSLITNWTKEFAKWTPGMRVKEFHGASKSERTKNLEKVQRRGGVVITTYNMLLNNWQILSSHNGREFTWDYMILDEAHKIKSTATKTAKSASAIPSKNRVLLTGTPVQNNLREMWALFDFACHGELLGTAKTFKAEYENPITRAREKDATPGEKVLGLRMSENLMAIIRPHFLRRTKAEVQKLKPSSPPQENGDGGERAENDEANPGATMPELTRKNDLIVWTYLSAVQEDIYRQFISLDHIKELLMTTKSPLAQLTILKKLCDHPRLLSAGSMAKLGLDDHDAGDSEGDTGHDITNVPDDTLISESGKMVFLFSLLERLRDEGHRTLVFAHYRKVLDILERILKNRGFKVMRMDGTITHTAERERRITLFQKDQSYTVFLLTTQVGGVGITLTAANRVVIYDPSWNPATDAQAVDRAYRIGQKENVVIYRLITCGTVEEKIYRRQVFKDSLIRQNTGDKKNPFRYFSKQELKELFTLEDTKSSTTQMQLQALHSRQRRTDAELDEHIAHLHAMEMFGISDHDLMFSVNAHQEEAPEDQEQRHYIEGRVQKAQELMKAECELQTQLAQSMASSTEAAWLRMDQPPRERKPRYPTQDLESPGSHSYQDHGAVVDLDRSGSAEKNVIDLTAEQSSDEATENSHESQEETRKIKTERGNSQNFTERNSTDHEEVVISDDETPQNGFQQNGVHSPRNIKSEMPHFIHNGDVSMNDLEAQEKDQNFSAINGHENGVEEIENGDRSMNNLVIEDSVEEAMDVSAQNLENKSEVRNGFTNAVEILSENHKLDQSTGDSSLSYFTADDDEKTQRAKMDLGEFHETPLKNKRLSVMQASFKSENGPNSSYVMDSLEGEFNLQLDDDSSIISDNDIFNDQKQTEEEERQILSKLQLDGSFSVDRSLAEHHNKEKSVINDVSEMNTSENDSVVATVRKKRVARIYSDDEDEEEQGREKSNVKDFEESFHMLGASTPKASAAASATLNRSRKSVNTSVASRRSFVMSLIDDIDNHEEEEEEKSGGSERDHRETEEDESEGEEEEEDGQADEGVEEESRGGVSVGDEESEPSGETLNSEEEELEEEEEEAQESLEESTADAELSSGERMDKLGPQTEEEEEEEDYETAVKRGRECLTRGRQEEALGHFLRAIDMKPGDAEIQLLTIKLYRQLSQNKY
ncbi:hypothetical protein NL108_018227 [Boleophthalmus pectinirostris]|uniref:DNA excision repair protein ERCC-6-like n=1 Tax=Boleophthalmus pectinirostris TaxID=150288 RepID=UPI00242DD4F1|nr:DNA excision repair protein ERCC-6-like [Boleophthalmus pectinirostris]KAJ0068256.1 hypothetical protein NL108_018227 [Boleophthalmus pectinirostris]